MVFETKFKIQLITIEFAWNQFEYIGESDEGGVIIPSTSPSFLFAR